MGENTFRIGQRVVTAKREWDDIEIGRPGVITETPTYPSGMYEMKLDTPGRHMPSLTLLAEEMAPEAPAAKRFSVGDRVVMVQDNDNTEPDPEIGTAGTVTAIGGLFGKDYTVQFDGEPDTLFADDNEIAPEFLEGDRVRRLADGEIGTVEDEADEDGDLWIEWDSGYSGWTHVNGLEAADEDTPEEPEAASLWPTDFEPVTVQDGHGFGVEFKLFHIGSEYFHLQVKNPIKGVTSSSYLTTEDRERLGNALLSTLPSADVADPEADYDKLADRLEKAVTAADGHPTLQRVLLTFGLGFALDQSPEANAALRALLGR